MKILPITNEKRTTNVNKFDIPSHPYLIGKTDPNWRGWRWAGTLMQSCEMIKKQFGTITKMSLNCLLLMQ